MVAMASLSLPEMMGSAMITPTDRTTMPGGESWVECWLMAASILV